jgi:hypothetical protein
MHSPFVVADEFDAPAHLPRIWGSKDIPADGSFMSDNRIKLVNETQETDLTYRSGHHHPRNRRGRVHDLIRPRRSRRP